MADTLRNFPSEASPKGAPMSEEEAEYWDDLFTRTTPALASGKGGFLTERRQQMILLDEKIVRYINAKANATHQTPAELVASFVRRDLAASE
ncbi:hypothetical protein LQZ19_18640 [Treponema primitia]|uniref:hypothetical protein n=1 Tax=Treponema primitia TaxID=88058 RepID=UPI00397ED7EC